MAKSVNSILSQTITFLRFPMIVGIVFIHAVNWSETCPEEGQTLR